MARESSDPTVVRSIAVTATDVVAALETNQCGGPRTVLRVTPPYSGRMRARLHRPRDGPGDAVHLEPASLVGGDAPPHPLAPAGGSPAAGEVDADAVAAWRAAVRERIVDRVALPVPGGGHEVEVSVLG